MTIPQGTDQTVDNLSMTLDSFANVQIPWTGEDVKHLDNGAGFGAVRQDQITQAIRALMNKVELAIATAAKSGSSRGYGTAGTTPFGSGISELAQIRKILADNGAPLNDGQWSLVMDTTASANLRSLTQLQKVNEAGEGDLLRQGTLSDLMGFMLKESAQITQHTKGAGTGYDFAAAGEAIGSQLVARQAPLAARRQWLADHLQLRGGLVLDDGAVRALVEDGKSLLPVGVKGVTGEFERGEVVAVVDAAGREVARGLVNYSASEARRIAGKPTSAIEAELGYEDEPELIHRDNLVVLR